MISTTSVDEVVVRPSTLTVVLRARGKPFMAFILACMSAIPWLIGPMFAVMVLKLSA